MANKITIDFSNIPDAFVPPGEYEGVINEVEFKTSEKTGNSYLQWEVELTEGEAAGRKVNTITSLVPSALFTLRDYLEICGVDPKAISELEVDEDSGLLLEPDLTGLPVRVLLIVDEYNGIKRNKIQRIIACHRPLNAITESEAEQYGVIDLDTPVVPDEPASDFEVASDEPDMTGYVDLSTEEEEKPV